MKFFRSILLVFTISLSALAQETPVPVTPPDIEIVFSYVGARQSSQLVETYRDFNTPGRQYLGSYNADLGIDPRNVLSVVELSRQPVTTEYALLRVKNTGAKTIKAIEWEAPHLNFRDRQLQVRLPIQNKVNLLTGETAHLKQTLPPFRKRMRMTAMTGPAGTHTFPQTSSFLFVQRDGLAIPPFETLTYTTDKGESYTIPANWRRQSISIKRIEYADGSVWQQ